MRFETCDEGMNDVPLPQGKRPRMVALLTHEIVKATPLNDEKTKIRP